MDLDKFHTAVKRVRAEQYFQEKAASARNVHPIELINQARAGEAADQVLFKVASTYSPEAPLALYEKLGGKFKQAEPPPPKGVSSKKWDEILGGKTP